MLPPDSDPRLQAAFPPLDPDTGVRALAALFAMHQRAVDPATLRHDLGQPDALSAADVIRLARRQPGVRARVVQVQPGRLSRQPLPALAHGPEGWFVIGRLLEDGVLIYRPGQRSVEKIDRDRLDTLWAGELVLVAVREPAGANSRFGLSWFIPQIVRYRRLIGEVLGITCLLNLLGLASPLLFQNVIDKVLQHNAVSTLNVLAIGFVAVAVWEAAFGWIRTRVYAETSQKIDVELGARVFRHLLSLPLDYFERRRVGDARPCARRRVYSASTDDAPPRRRRRVTQTCARARTSANLPRSSRAPLVSPRARARVYKRAAARARRTSPKFTDAHCAVWSSAGGRRRAIVGARTGAKQTRTED